ncbi:hypothetical protein QMO56_21225 [Roseomonas sp. E05]|uniref:hypothetical protein n=1 Tax=Roseomonas sp. E05 TaxID=3046310 RepID=UPI0024B9E0D6|nr:hypothetical protein [Roseomonas sp. E05]MDJ0390640.1 hypothetical protein [Roseomonas sp. E05]
MNDLAVARALHVLAVVLWIGGVGMVTTVILPAVRRAYPAGQRFGAFHSLESRFARQARLTTLLAGISGFYLTWRLEAWERFQSLEFWWMHAMLLTWLAFTTMLFVLEPFFLDRFLARQASSRPEATYRFVERLHWLLLSLSLLTVGGAVAGSHGIDWSAW